LIAPATYDFLDPDGLKGLPEMRGVWSRVLAYNPLLHLPEFMIGMATGWLFMRAPERASRFRHSGWLAGAALVAIIIGLIGGARLPSPPMHVLLTPLFALLIYALANGGGALGALLSRPAVVLLGEMSFALYLLQKPLWLAWQAIDERLAPDGATDYARLRFFLVYALCLLASSALTYWLVERPARDTLRRLLIRRRDHPAPTRVVGEGSRGAPAARPAPPR
jgi:peptidoglycan/LPS O-acetylase OafA/YrhL